MEQPRPIDNHPDSDQPLRVSAVTVFRNGVGQFTHEGTISGDREVRLQVAPEAIDDLLQSLLVADPEGSAPQVRFPAKDPLERILASYSLDLTHADTLGQVLRQARGEAVTVTSTEQLSGRIIGVDTVTDPRGPEQTFLGLSTASGLRRLALGDLRSIRFDDEQVQADLDAALAAVAGHRSRDDREVVVQFRGTGERRVSLAYVRPMPVWKTAYRLSLTDDGYADLQGWAIVDNPTSTDLTEVSVSVVAGQPMSFTTNLAEPRHVDRPRVDPAVTENVVPTAYRQRAARAMAAPAPAAVQGEWMSSADLAAPAFAAPQRVGGGRGQELSADVRPEADAAQVGLEVAYTVREPVSIPRYSSAMIPILAERFPAARLSVLDPTVDADHPMRGLLLRNESELQLAAGPVTVFDGGYAGTAELQDLLPGDQQVLTHARDLAVTVHQGDDLPVQRRNETALVDGMVRTTTTQTAALVFELDSTAATDRLVMLIVPDVPGAELLSVGPEPLREGGQRRFGVFLRGRRGESGGDDPESIPVQVTGEAGERVSLEIAVRTVQHRDVAVASAPGVQLRLCLDHGELTEQQRGVLTDLAQVAAQRTTVEQELAEVQRHRGRISDDQERIRGNLNSLDHSSQLYQRYLATLNGQEDELVELWDTEQQLGERLQQLWARGTDLARQLSRAQ
ncbi:hypothetical protein HJ590_16655 [Naumannella sp. ID2617S]|nr:hypothetical protein [Naumannella sp. ID2617S]